MEDAAAEYRYGSVEAIVEKCCWMEVELGF